MRHKHRMHVAGLDYATGMASATGLRQTVILFRCENIQGPDCVESKTVSGRWDMHDLDAMPRTWPAEITRDDLPAVEGARDAGTGAAGPAAAGGPDQSGH